jgi:hypothetical protein
VLASAGAIFFLFLSFFKLLIVIVVLLGLKHPICRGGKEKKLRRIFNTKTGINKIHET